MLVKSIGEKYIQGAVKKLKQKNKTYGTEEDTKIDIFI